MALVRKGTWPILVCTRPFQYLANVNAKAMGYPVLDIIVVDGDEPIGARDEAQLDEAARHVATKIRELAGTVDERSS